MYPEELVLPMKEELTENGFTELLTSDDVTRQLQQILCSRQSAAALQR